MGPAPNWTVDDYAGHWLPAFQSGAQIGAQRRRQDLDEAEFEQEKKESDQRMGQQDRLEAERRARQQAIAEAMGQPTASAQADAVAAAEAQGLPPSAATPPPTRKFSLDDLPPAIQADMVVNSPELYGRLQGQKYREEEDLRQMQRFETEAEIDRLRLGVEKQRAEAIGWENFFRATGAAAPKPPTVKTTIDPFGKQTTVITRFGEGAIPPPNQTPKPAPQTQLVDDYNKTIAELEAMQARRAAGDKSTRAKVEIDFGSRGEPKINKEWSLWPYWASNDEDLDVQIKRLRILRDQISGGAGAAPGMPPSSNVETNRFRFQVGPGGTLR